MYRHIFVAIGTSLSEQALSAAIARARECNARLTALHVVDQTPWWAVVTADCNSAETLAVIDDHARAVRRYSARMMDRAGIDGVARSVVMPLSGESMGEVIAAAARECGADLVVLGGEDDHGWRHGEPRLRDVVCAGIDCDVLIASHGPMPGAADEMERIEARFAMRAAQQDGKPARRRIEPRHPVAPVSKRLTQLPGHLHDAD